jgi:hypothetical protein
MLEGERWQTNADLGADKVWLQQWAAVKVSDGVQVSVQSSG